MKYIFWIVCFISCLYLFMQSGLISKFDFSSNENENSLDTAVDSTEHTHNTQQIMNKIDDLETKLLALTQQLNEQQTPSPKATINKQDNNEKAPTDDATQSKFTDYALEEHDDLQTDLKFTYPNVEENTTEKRLKQQALLREIAQKAELASIY